VNAVMNLRVLAPRSELSHYAPRRRLGKWKVYCLVVRCSGIEKDGRIFKNKE
jgi:hypothetical protein